MRSVVAAVALALMTVGCSIDDAGPSVVPSSTSAAASSTVEASAIETTDAPSVTADTTAAADSAASRATAPAESTGPTDSTADFEMAVAGYVAAFGTGNVDGAWATVSNRCQGVVPEKEYKAAVASSGQLYAEMAAVNVSVEIDGDQGRASYETGVDAIGPYDQQPWRLEDGRWKWDDC